MDPEIEIESPHWASWMRAIRYASALAVLALIAASVRVFYPPARNEHLLRIAKVFVDNRELRSATLSLQQVMVSDPRNVHAVRMMADLSEATGSPQTLVWRRRVVEIAPDAFAYRVEWIKSALKMGEIALAAEGLATIDEAGRRTGVFHHLAASIAIAWNQLPEAEAHEAIALKLEPDNDGYKFNLALIWMQAADEARRRKGLEIMSDLSSHSEFRYRALRAMIDEALAATNSAEATRISWELQVEPQSTLEDRLEHLDLLTRNKDPKLGEFLRGVQIAVADNAELVLSVALWMNKNGRAREALDWANSLPPPMQMKAPVRMAEAEAFAALGDWKGLEAFIETADWRSFEFLRRAYLARMARAREQSEIFQDHWNGAVRLAGNNTGPLAMLNRLARDWGWHTESDELLWDVASGGFNNRWALEALYEKYEKAGDSRSLYQVILRMLEIKPTDVVARNNFVLLSLLLNLRTDQAHRIALELYRQYPNNPILVSTYAFSLLSQKKAQAALNVFKSLKEEQLAEPSVAAYYSLVLSAVGDQEKARQFRTLSRQAKLLPEERALMEQVM